MAWPSAINTDNGLARTNHRRSLPEVRVIAGDLRGRRIEAPITEATRPTTDKVREAVFNALGSMGVIDGARILDLFAGTGAMGIEALSRGADECVFVEKDRDALRILRSNIDHLGLSGRSTVIAGDAVSAASHQRDIDILIADPPYGFTDWASLLDGVSVGLVVLESDKPIGDIAGWETVREKKYGRTFVSFLESGRVQGDTVEAE